MGDGVTGTRNAPVHQTTHAGNTGASSAADSAAQSKFGDALKQESLCPEGLSRRPPDGCTYLRNPSQPLDLQFHGDPDRFKGPVNRSNGPTTQSPSLSCPQTPLKSLRVPFTAVD